MIIKVTADGALIPKNYLNGAAEVDLRRDGNRLVVVPIVRDGPHPLGEDDEPLGPAPDDPILQLGKDPVTGGAPDGSENLDYHIYVKPIEDLGP